ncbi:MAG TPA: DNA sulfur modification protein DndD [Bacteroidales bacterium]|nr:DNA sulfur modification protein DndD [Bacteroidales bacterium]
MIIKRIKAKNFKTYLNLDLDISVEPDKPIILIGGANGGGKTTLFEAVYGALYGLNIHSAGHFHEMLNAGALAWEEKKIMLELYFSGLVLNEEQQYVLTRQYVLNPSGLPVESVKLNMNGTIFQYGTATPPAQRATQEAEVAKIIKANLPQELSRYFLFDAMEAGKLLKEDQLNRVIRENIENVMGFNKYMALAKSAENLHRAYTAQRLQVENEKKEYLGLVAKRKALEGETESLKIQLQDALNYSVANKELFDALKSGLGQETTIKNKIDQLSEQISNINKKELQYAETVDTFIKEIELNVILPKLRETLRSEIMLILKERRQREQQENALVNPEQVRAITELVIKYLSNNKITTTSLSIAEIIDFVIANANKTDEKEAYAYLEFSEVKALENLLNVRATNSWPAIHQQQAELDISIAQVPGMNKQIDQMKAQISGRDYTLLKTYEENENTIKKLEILIAEKSAEITKIDKSLHQFDIQTNQEPDPRYEALGKLKAFFEQLANRLLMVKKTQIEQKMKQDLNINLAAYKDVIARVELSENLASLTFKIYHKAGNEIYLNQLNAASKQVVVQVLLKALHEFGDYDPPVMIDTVMGVLDEESRLTVLENYFPELSEQTILLSSDSEIRTEKDYPRIEPFVSKTYTLTRDRENQLTTITNGYFGITLNHES